MKTLLLTGALLLATSTANAIEWKASCNSDYTNWFGKYTFEVKKGEVGGCKSDKIKQSYPIQSWDWSERSEVKSRGHLGLGKYVWSSTIDITRNCKPAWRNTIFQIHAGGHLTNPPSWFGINEHNQFRTVHNIMYNNDSTSVPDSPFELRAEFDITKRSVKVDYYVNDKFVVSTKDNQGPYKDLFMKFGIYRVNANCDIKQTYTNVNFKRVK